MLLLLTPRIKFFYASLNFLLLIVYCLLLSPAYGQELSFEEENTANTITAPTSDTKKIQLSIGILSYTPSASLKNSPWEETFARLNTHQKYHFSPIFLSSEQLIDALENDRLDFVICDAISYANFAKQHGILRLLTRSNYYSEQIISSEGLSVHVLNNNSKISQLNDLKNKNIGILDVNSSMSRLFLDYFLSQNKLFPNDNIFLEIINNTQDALNQLYTGQIDALISKSGLIYSFKHQENSTDRKTPESFSPYAQKLRILNPHQNWQIPFLHSSILIPEWPIAKSWFIDETLANDVITSLLDNDIESASFFSDQYQWSIAKNYNAVSKLFFPDKIQQEYNTESSDNFSPKIQYWLSFIIICFLVIMLILHLHSSKGLNSKLTLSKESLEQEIKERQFAQEQALNHQAELAHVARLSTMGEMASGLAHELNQPLSAINTYVQGSIRRINMGTDKPEDLIYALQQTAQQAERAAGIIRRLRSFVRKGESHKTYSDINHLVNEVNHFLEIQLKNKSVKLVLELENDLPPILADIIQIEQVLINLLKNAIESMSEIENPEIILRTKRRDHNLIELCVIDSGHGISKDKLKRIFNPFFTTKSSGMGMGLSISSSIIEAHNGTLYAKNNPILGAQFCFTLPTQEEFNQEEMLHKQST